MYVRNWIRKRLGMETGRHLLDPRVYPSEELEGDILEVQFELNKRSKKVSELNERYQALINQGAEASSLERQRLSQEADNVERQHKFAARKYEQLTKKLGLLYAIKGVRELLDDSMMDLTLDEVLEGAETGRIRSAIRGELRNHQFEENQIDEILTALDFSAEVDVAAGASATGVTAGTDVGAVEGNKHVDRMQEVAESQAMPDFDLFEEHEEDEEDEKGFRIDGL